MGHRPSLRPRHGSGSCGDVVSGRLESVPVGHIVDLVCLAISSDVAEEALHRQHRQLIVDLRHGASLLTRLPIAGLVAKRILGLIAQIHTQGKSELSY